MLELDKKYESYTEILDALPRETIAMVGGAPLTIPIEVPAVIPLAYARTIKNNGQDIALSWALDLMLTEDGASLLLSSNISDAQLSRMVDLIIGRVRGASVGTADVDAGPKASTSGAPKSAKPAATRASSRAVKNS